MDSKQETIGGISMTFRLETCPYCGNKGTCRFAGGDEPCLVNDIMAPIEEQKEVQNANN